MIDKSDNNETDNLDAAPEPEDTKPAKPPKARGAGFALFIAFLALFFTAAGIAAGYKHWQRMSDRAKGNARDIAALEEVIASKSDHQAVENMLADISNSHNEQQQQIAGQLAKMNQIYRQTEQFGNTVTSQVEQITALQATLQSAVAPEMPKAWHMAEVSFLLKLASRELHLSANRAAAAAALREADQILSETGSVSYLPVRQQIATDLTELEAMDVADIAGLSQQITVLSRQLKPVPDTVLLNDPVPADNRTETIAEPQQAETTDTEATNNSSAWQDYKDKAAKILSDAIIIRQLDQPLADELSFTAREQAYQVLQLRLEALRLMVLQRRDDAYRQQLQLIRETIDSYYPAGQATGALQTLDQLAEVQLNPTLPDISGSLRQLEKARMAEVSQ